MDVAEELDAAANMGPLVKNGMLAELILTRFVRVAGMAIRSGRIKALAVGI